MLGPSMAAAHNDKDLSGYLCNLQTQIVSAQAEAQLRELFKLAGKDWPEDDRPAEHCNDCVMPLAAVQAAAVMLPQISAPRRAEKQLYTVYALGFAYHATGPPLGSRAPPLSL